MNSSKRASQNSSPIAKASAETFSDYAISRFDVAKIMELLVAPDAGIRGSKQVAFAGFCAWLQIPSVPRPTAKTKNSPPKASSRTPRLLRDAMLLKAARFWVAASDKIMSQTDGDMQSVLNHLRSYRAFNREIYAPLGGLSVLITTRSLSGHRRHVAKRYSRAVSVLAQLVEVLHYRLTSLPDNPASLWPTTIPKAVNVLQRFHGQQDGQNPKQLLKYRQLSTLVPEYRHALALIYVAHRTNIKDESLLDLIISNRLSFKKAYPHLPKLFAQARWITENVLSKVELERRWEFLAITFGPAEPLEPPEFTAQQVEAVRAEFRRHRLLPR